MARRYDNVEPEVPPEEDGLDHLGKSLTAEQIKHEEELARLAVSCPMRSFLFCQRIVLPSSRL